VSDTTPLSDGDRARLADGDPTAILDLLSDILPAWGTIDENAIMVEALAGGYSGASVFKVSADSADILPLLLRIPGSHDENPASQLFLKPPTHGYLLQRSVPGAPTLDTPACYIKTISSRPIFALQNL